MYGRAYSRCNDKGGRATLERPRPGKGGLAPVPRKRNSEGIRPVHSKRCATKKGRRCSCTPSWEANVWLPKEKDRRFKTFRSRAEAQAWRRSALIAIDNGTMRAATPLTLAEALQSFVEGAEDGTIRSRKGEPYKPSSIRGYKRCIELRLVPALGGVRLCDLERRDVQAFVDQLLVEGLDPSTIKNTLNPLQAVCRRAVQRDLIKINPTAGLDVPAARGTRERIASPSEAAALLEALPAEDRPLWATAMYAGLRRGELRGLRWSDVDLAQGVIRVERGWDDVHGQIDAKTRAGRRTVPIAAVLRDYLLEHKARTKCAEESLVFETRTGVPFEPSTIRRRALAAWKAAGHEPIMLHQARHTFASLMIAAGVNAKALSSYMGHASVSITFDRYGHLMPGNEAEAADRLDAYLARSASGPQTSHTDPGTYADTVGPNRTAPTVRSREAA